ncbi:MAG: hypothetical protein JXB30_17285 [Anaerolineae bacterium]|nr:hypothetical protein [Anaerolineae bacterium]
MTQRQKVGLVDMLGGGRPAEQEKNSQEIDVPALPPNLRNSALAYLTCPLANSDDISPLFRVEPRAAMRLGQQAGRGGDQAKDRRGMGGPRAAQRRRGRERPAPPLAISASMGLGG